MPDVFISYARSSEATARAAAHALEAVGLEVWWDEQLPTHRAYYEVIEERLREASAVLVLWSDEAAKSQWVRAEADLARSLNKLVQASVDDSLPPMPFNQIQCAQLKTWKGRATHSEWRKVLASIAALTGPAADSATADSSTIPIRRGRPSWRRPLVLTAVGLVIALAVGVFAYEAATTRDGPESTDIQGASIAVLPFETPAGDPAAEAFASALTDDLGGVLSENNLQPLSREQAKTLSGGDRMARLRTLGAAFALTGTVRREDGLIKVRANLLAVESNAVLWSEAFERAENDAASLRGWVASRSSGVAEMALISATGDSGQKLDPQILALTIRGNLGFSSGDPMELAAGRRALEQVVARAPNLALGHASYALSLVFDGLTGSPAERASQLAKARDEANTAIRLNPAQSEGAYGTLYVLSRSEPPVNLAKSEDLLIATEKVSPAFAFMMMSRCQLLFEAGRIQEAMPLCQRATVIHPLANPLRSQLALAYFMSGQNERARTTIKRLWSENPNDPQARERRLLISLFGSDPNIEAIVRDPSQLPQSADASAIAALQAFLTARRSHAPDDIDHALKQLAAATAHRKIEPAIVVLAATELGRPDAAFAALDVIAWNGLLVTPVMMAPQTAPLRRDPRFWGWAERVGLVDYWRTRGVLPDFCADPGAGVDCKSALAAI